MFIQIIGVGKLKEKYLTLGIQEYAKRLSPYIKFQMIEVADEKAPDTLSEAEVRERARGRTHPRACEERGACCRARVGWPGSGVPRRRHWKIDKLGTYGTSHVVFVIGGSHGLSDEVLRRAKQRLSFGRMTLPHQLMRLVLVEQIYRAVKINRGNHIISRGKFLRNNSQEPVLTACRP